MTGAFKAKGRDEKAKPCLLMPGSETASKFCNGVWQAPAWQRWSGLNVQRIKREGSDSQGKHTQAFASFQRKERARKKEKTGYATAPCASGCKLPRALFDGPRRTLPLNILWEKLVAIGDWEMLRDLLAYFILSAVLEFEPRASCLMTGALPRCYSSSLEKLGSGMSFYALRGQKEGLRQVGLLESCGNSMGEYDGAELGWC